MSPATFFDMIELYNEETKKLNGDKEVNYTMKGIG